MCGIAGLLAPAGAAPELVALEAMTAALAHRGPDHGAVAAFGRCALGYRRLTVVDLGATGLQPVTNERGDVACVFNGEIYNFRELRAQLAAQGHDVPGTGDTQILPHLYEQHGPRFVERLDGMFALAVWDARRERLLLARDRVGKKPLVWTRLAGGTLAFASEAKALVEVPDFDRGVDLAAIDAYLSLGYVPGEQSAFGAVRRVPPGHVLVVEEGAQRLERYWEPRVVRERRSEREWLELVRTELERAVRRRLIADVPLGALLSGGIDSSIVVALMAQAASEPVRTFSIGFPDERYDERAYARQVAARYGTEHEELVVEPRAAELVPRLARAWDEPFADSSALPTFLVCELARRRITVALTGDGGDEAFAGYERYVAAPVAARVPAAPARAAARLLRAFPAARREPRSAPFRAARLLEASAAGAGAGYARLLEIFPEPLRRRLWSDDALARLGELGGADVLRVARRPSTTSLQLLDVRTYLPGDLLVKADIASMANSLELRSPFLDHRVLELGLSLPDALKTRGRTGKVALRRAFAQDLPPEIVRRAKKGFGVPLARWFRGELRDLAFDVLLDGRARGRGLLRPAAVEQLLGDHVAARADHGARLWALVMLELWQREYVDGARERVDAAPAAAPARA